MKRLLINLLILGVAINSYGQIRWDGGGDGTSWNDPANWLGNIVPISTDNVLIDNSIVTSNYFINLPAGNISTVLNSLTITPTGTNTITVTLPNTNTAAAGLQINGSGDAFVINAGGIFVNASGATSGTPVSVTTTNFFRINNGGIYVHRTPRGHTNNLISRLSAVPGTENGTVVFDVPAASYFISATGRTYGNLVFSSQTNINPVTYSANGASDLTVNGNFILNDNTSFVSTMSANINIKQNLVLVTATTSFDIQANNSNNITKVMGDISSNGAIKESGIGNPVLELNGTTNQNILMAGPFTDNILFRINNSTGATLQNDLTLPANLDLLSGKIFTDVGSTLTLKDNATYTGGASSSFVHGPMKKIGDDNFVFPVGKGSIYAPIGIIDVSGENTNDEFTAEYLRTNPQNINGTLVEAGQDHISSVEYWTLNSNGVSPVKKILLTINYESFCYDMTQTYVSRFDATPPPPSPWRSLGAGPIIITGTNPPFQRGTITSVANTSQFGDFTLITNLLPTLNPLPIKLTDFTATKNNNTTAAISWELEVCCSKYALFEVQKSGDGRSFSAMRNIPGSETDRRYSIIDNRLSEGTNYYRLKMTDYDGKITYSRIAALINKESGLLITSVWPNPVSDNFKLAFSAATSSSVNITIIDISGRIVKQFASNAATGMNTLDINCSNLPNTTYHLYISDNKNNRTVTRFIKQ
jgi:hypothetical protein